MSGRCKACNEVLGPKEIIWIPWHDTHEPLCRVCRNEIEYLLLYDDKLIELELLSDSFEEPSVEVVPYEEELHETQTG